MLGYKHCSNDMYGPRYGQLWLTVNSLNFQYWKTFAKVSACMQTCTLKWIIPTNGLQSVLIRDNSDDLAVLRLISSGVAIMITFIRHAYQHEYLHRASSSWSTRPYSRCQQIWQMRSILEYTTTALPCVYRFICYMLLLRKKYRGNQ